MKTWKRIILAIIALFLIIQLPFFTPKKNFTEEDTQSAMTDKYEVPMNIQMYFYASCFDCHSNYTQEYPWYYHIQPVSWWMDMHIKNAKKHLNFSEFGNYSLKEASHKFHELNEVMTDHSMPLASYLWLHEDAKFTPEQYEKVAQWAKKMHEQLEAKIDSLEMD